MNIDNGNRIWVNLQILFLFVLIIEIKQIFRKEIERSG